MKTIMITLLGSLAAVAAVGTSVSAVSGAPGAAPTTSVAVTVAEAPLSPPVTSGPMTATVVDSHYSSAASHLVVVIEISATAIVSPGGYSATYVGPDGQQVDAAGVISPDEVFPGATSLVVLSFPAATPGGNVVLPGYDDDYNDLTVTLAVPAV